LSCCHIVLSSYPGLPCAQGGENSHIEALNFYPIFIPLDECKVSGASAAAGQKNGRSNRKRNSEKSNVEYRMTNDE
jgi:hypothetical protein